MASNGKALGNAIPWKTLMVWGAAALLWGVPQAGRERPGVLPSSGGLAPVWEVVAGPEETAVRSLVALPDSYLIAPLPPLDVQADLDGPGLQVAPFPGGPYHEVRLQNGRGRIPFGIPNPSHLPDLHFRTSAEAFRALLTPSSPLCITVSPGELFAVANWGPEGSVSVVVRDAGGLPVGVEDLGASLREEGEGSFSATVDGPGSVLRFRLLPDGLTLFPVTVTATREDGARAAATAYRAEAGSGLCATPGKDGAGGTLTGVVNTYLPLTASVSSGANALPVGAAAGAPGAIEAGDLLLLIQMQDAEMDGSNSDAYGDGVAGGTASGYTGLNGSGTYEFVVADGSVAAGSLPIRGAGAGGGTLYAYSVSPSTSLRGRQSAQVVRVPQFASATLGSGLTCMAWNGEAGGILALDVSGRLTLGGTVSVDGLGFRGGAQVQLSGAGGVLETDYRILAPASPPVGCFAMKGEGIAGTPRGLANAHNGSGLDGFPNGDFGRGAPGTAGGGGNDGAPNANSENAGGGGGGNGGAGGRGGNTWNSNLPLGGYGGVSVAPAANRLLLGAGGGAGSRNNVASGGDGSGGAGGGIVLIRALAVTGVGTITANGADAPTSVQDAAGGGGAGGTILVYSRSGDLAGLTVKAEGGAGGDAWPLDTGGTANRHGPGGGGGGGILLLSHTPGLHSVNGGPSGISTTLNDAYGSLPGSAGAAVSGVSGTEIPGADAGSECLDAASFISKISSAGTGYVSPGQTLTYTITVTNTTPSTWTDVTVADPLPDDTSYVTGTSQLTSPTTVTGSYRDEFDARAYNGSNGSLGWSTSPWVEFGDDGSPTSGEVQVNNDLSAFALEIQNINRGVRRQADLSAYSSGTLNFLYRRVSLDNVDDWVEVQISSAGTGGPWTTLARYAGPTNDSTLRSASFDVSAHISATTVVRFLSSPTLGGGDSFYADDVEFSLSRRDSVTVSGGAPPSLASGLTLLPGESLTASFEVTVNTVLGPGVTEIANTATLTANGGAISQPATVSNPLLPAPVVAGPILSTDSAVSGTSTVIGGVVTVYRNGLPMGTATVEGDGTWVLVGVSGLSAGDSITADVTLGGATSPPSAAVFVSPPPPAVAGPLTAGATTVTGTSSTPAGSTITVYRDGSAIGTTTVQPDGTWSLTGISPALAAGEQIKATVTAGGKTSADSNVVTVQHPAPAVSGPIVASPFVNSVSGTSSSPVGTTITVFVNGIATGTTTVQADGTWSLTGISGLVGGESITATAGTGAVQSVASSPVGVVPYPPVVDSPAYAGATSVTGTSDQPAGSLVTVYVNGLSIGTATVQADGTWTLAGLSTPLAEGDTLTAVVTVSGQTSSLSAEVTVAADSADVTPPPWVTSPIYAGAVRASGTSASPEGTRIDVFVDGAYVGSTTVTSVGTWTLNLAPGVSFLDGQVVCATATDEANGLGTSTPSPEVVVSANAADRTPSPVLTSPVYGGATDLSGTSVSPEGTRIDVYADGVFLGTTTVQADGSWTLSGIGPLEEGAVLQATATDVAGGHGTSTPSAPVTVLAVRSTPPIVSASLLAGSPGTIFGSSVEAPGSVITVFVNGVSAGVTTVNADGSWSLPGVVLAAGDLVKATVLASGKSVSADSNVVRVSGGASGVTPPPVISAPIASGATTVSGTAEPGAAVDLYAEGVFLGTVTADAGGDWVFMGLPPAEDGAVYTATATLAPNGTSDWSAPVVAGTAIHLLRSDAMTSLTQDRRPLFTHATATLPYPSLETLGPNHAFNASEGSDALQPSAPDTADDDKGYLRNVTTGTLDPDPTVLTDNGRPLVFYELLDNNSRTLKLEKAGTSIRILIE